MKNKILFTILLFFSSIHWVGCSLFSSSSEEEKQTQMTEQVDPSGASGFDERAEESSNVGSDNVEADIEKGIGNDVQDEYSDDEYPDEFTGNSLSANGMEEGASAPDEGGGLPETAMEENQEKDIFRQDNQDSFVSEPMMTDPPQDMSDTSDMASNTPPLPVPDEMTKPMESSSQLAPDSSSMMMARPSFVPVKKMKPSAYKRAGTNINRLYVVRAGENMKSIAMKIYGQDLSEQLYSYNSHFVGKSLKVGDKIYYRSPSNAEDPGMMTYYEENGIAPQYYEIPSEGESLRSLGKKLLGHQRSWMEIYATNENVQSKGNLPGGLRIRYWPNDASAPMAVADSPQPMDPPPAPMEEEPVAEQPQEGMNQDMGDMAAAQQEEPPPPQPSEIPPPPPEEMAQAEQGISPPPPQELAQNDQLPPPAAGTMEPPPPPPPPEEMAAASMQMEEKPPWWDDENLLYFLAGGLILLVVIILLVLRRNRSRKVSFGHNQN